MVWSRTDLVSTYTLQAYEQGILYPRYIFLFYGWYVDNWWVGSDSENLTCTAEQRAMVVRSTLAPVQDEFITDCSKTANSGIVSTHTICIVVVF